MSAIIKNNWLNIKQNCVLCSLLSKNIICTPCFNDLPWLKNRCDICALPLSTSALSHLTCRKCESKKPHFNKVIALFNYQFPIDRMMPKTKKEHQRYHFKWLAECFVPFITHYYNDTSLPEAIIPVPISKRKRILKSYNQAEYLAQMISKRLHITVEKNIVTKIKNTPAQATLSAKERQFNLKGAFQVKQRNYKHVAIIDDVLTTGSTADEIAKELKKSGIQTVDVWVIARTPI